MNMRTLFTENGDGAVLSGALDFRGLSFCLTFLDGYWPANIESIIIRNFSG